MRPKLDAGSLKYAMPLERVGSVFVYRAFSFDNFVPHPKLHQKWPSRYPRLDARITRAETAVPSASSGRSR